MTAMAARWTGNGVVNGTAVTTANVNSPGNSSGSGVVWSQAVSGSPNFTYDSDGFRVRTVGTTDIARIDAVLASNSSAVRLQLKLIAHALPQSALNAVTIRNSSSGPASFILYSTGGGTVQALTGGYIVEANFPVTNPGDELLIDMVATQSSTPTNSNGRIFYRVINLSRPQWNGNGEHFWDSGYSLNLGTEQFLASRFGKLGNSELPGDGVSFEFLGVEAISVNPADTSESQAKGYFADAPGAQSPVGSPRHWHVANGVRRPLQRIFGPTTPGDGGWSDDNPPWALKAGESVTDNMPSGVTVVNIEDYSTSTDIYTALMAVTNAVSGHVYVQLQARTYYINTFRDYGNNQYLGHANSNRRIMGLIGHGADQTKVRVAPSAISSNPDAMDYVLNATGLGTSGGGPILLTALYWSNTSSTAPLFLSGIDFQGTLQTPFSTYSTASQAHFRRNHAAPSPLAWNGMAIWRGIAGSRVQFCKFTGFGFALNSAPPFECGALGCSWNNGLVIDRVEVDGRIPAEVDPSRPRASGSIMWNKEPNIQLKDVWMHHTRRSGWATNTNTNSQSETYRGTNVKSEEIANFMDSWAGDNGFFNGSNVEEVVGTFTYNNVHLNVAQGHHINWAVPYSNANGVVPVPTHTVFFMRGFTTDDTLYGGCLRIQVSRNPNSTGQSRVWERVNAVGPAASGFFDIRRSDGTPLTPVRGSQWNSSMSPSQYFVVNY